jgi:hypothetical protein
MPRKTPITRAKLFNLACADKRYSVEIQIGNPAFDVLQRRPSLDGDGYTPRIIQTGVRCYADSTCCAFSDGGALNFGKRLTCRQAAQYLDLLPKE